MCESVCVAVLLHRWQRTGRVFLTQCGEEKGLSVSVRVERRREGRECIPLVFLAIFHAMGMSERVLSGAWLIFSPW